ncbi:O-succinylbenzoic acid--CoA ligase [Nonlabens spongiae]|uniref:O-succinylbenzoic acid--CoA ligase n=1 Tax=Nonlabens spongiae TaxID=331648 RepID=A0A1W6MNK5_9FLAO|nr:AMP-binding protein [Nonlabens spongiae]ARN79175.1 O-succinylbenzoic acid--CoA ligase [Nonlabens spongiae]
MIPKVHPRFKLNGRSLDHEGLMTVAYSYVKEGEDWEKEIGDFLLNWLDDFEVLTVYSSGSTGTPKINKLQKEHMINSAKATNTWFNLPEECDALCCLPLSFIAGKMMMVRALTLGWQLDVVKPSASPFKTLRKRYDFTALTNYQVLNSLDDIHKSVKIIIGGGPVAKNLPELLKNKHTKAYHTYGMTETSSHIAIRKIHPVYEEAYCTLTEDITVKQDDRGCLVVHAPFLLSNDIVTNDIVELTGERNFKILGRIDRVINSGGVKIYPEIVEEKLSELITSRFFVTGTPSDELGQEVVLVVEGEERDLPEFKNFGKYEMPKKVYFLKEFKETHTGKVDRKASLEALLAMR